ncbi:MAG: RNA polymerase sigma factor [Chloroflexota bacterium]
MNDLALAYQAESTLAVPCAALEEQEWVERARAGDMDAFDAIMIRYEPRLLRFLTGVVYDAETARELCQDTFLAAYQFLPRLRGEVRLSAWLHTIALNRARSYHRRRRLRLFLPIEEEYFKSAPVDIGDAIAANELVERVLARMPKKYAHALLLQLASGLSCREIAGVVGCSEGAVKVRLLRAREHFRCLYQEEDRGPCT